MSVLLKLLKEISLFALLGGSLSFIVIIIAKQFDRVDEENRKYGLPIWRHKK